jgi:hypothetical protein
MTEQSFVHDESNFDPAQSPTGVELSDSEAKYAELFGEVIWDGIITADEREQLNTAASVFGLAAERVSALEQALTATYEARHQIRIVDGSPEAMAAAPEQQVLAPLAASGDPRLQALQRRIAVVEKRNEELRHRNADLKAANAKLEETVAKLQHDVELARQELSYTHVALGARPAGEPAAPPGAGAAPVEEARFAPGRVMAAPRSLLDEDSTYETFDLPSAHPSQGDEPTQQRARGGLLGGHGAEAEGKPAAGGVVRGLRGDPADIHRLVRRSPRDVELLRTLYGMLQRGDDLDRRWCLAHVLCYLGAATDEERATHDKHATSVVVRPVRAVNKDEWSELLMHPDEDRLTGEIVADIAPAVLLGQLSALRREGAIETSTPADIVDPKSSKLDAVRCLVWAAAFLGLKVPPISVAPAAPGLVELVITPRPATRLGKQALEGRTVKELAFLAGRHLSWYRGEHILGKLASSTRHLEDVFLAALMIGNPGLPMADEIKQRVEPIARTIAPLLDAVAVSKLRGYFARFVEQGGRTNLHKWRRAADRTAACTGLLLANDLHAAEAILKLEDEAQLVDRMDELLVFFTAGRCSLLRKRIGIAIPAV